MGKYLDFLLTLVLRFLSGAFFGGCVGFVYHWLPFLNGSARGHMPWGLLKTWALVGGLILMVTVPRYQYPWRKPRERD